MVLSAEALDEAFPFHLRFGRDLILREVSARLRKQFPDMQAGLPLAEHWSIARPKIPMDFDALQANRGLGSTITHRTQKFRLRGQFLANQPDEELIFVGKPWAESISELAATGITLADYAGHDSMADSFLAVQRQEELIKDLKAERAQLSEKVEARTQELSATLNREADRSRFSRTIQGIWNLDDLFMRMAILVAEIMQFDDCVLYLREGSQLIQKGAHGIKMQGNEITQPIIISVGTGIVGRCAASASPIRVADVAQIEDYIPDVYPGASELAVPVIYRGDVLGVFDSESKTPGKFTQADEEMLTALARIAAPAIVAAQSIRSAEAQASKEREQLRLKNRLFQTSSHEFRTPLTQLISSADILVNYWENLDDQVRREKVESMQTAISRLKVLIDQVLSFREVQQSNIGIQERETNLLLFMEQSVPPILEAHARSEDLILEISSGLEDASTDPEFLFRIISNLVTNAAKYSEKGTPIRITAHPLSSGFRIEVEDHGRGIPAADQESVFEAYFRHPNASDTPGAGLGLAIAKEAVERLGGHIELTSTPGKGTTFRVEIPEGPLG